MSHKVIKFSIYTQSGCWHAYMIICVYLCHCISVCIYIYIFIYIFIFGTHAPTKVQPNHFLHLTLNHLAHFWAEIYIYIFRPPPDPGKAPRRLRFLFWVQGSKPQWLHGDATMLGPSGPSSIRGLGHRKGIDETTENVQRELQDKLLATWRLFNWKQKFTPDFELSGFVRMHLLPPSLPTHVAKVLGHFRTKLNQRSDKSNVDSREFRQTRTIVRRIWLLHVNLCKTFSKRLTQIQTFVKWFYKSLGTKVVTPKLRVQPPSMSRNPATVSSMLAQNSSSPNAQGSVIQ